MKELTKRQIAVLQWLYDNPSRRAQWMIGGRRAWGPPETWTHLRIVGMNGRITVKAEDWSAVRPFIVERPKRNNIFEVNRDGVFLIHRECIISSLKECLGWIDARSKGIVLDVKDTARATLHMIGERV